MSGIYIPEAGTEDYERRLTMPRCEMSGCVHRTSDNQCHKYSDPARNTMSWCVGDDPCEGRTPSNADRIRAMTDEELATFIRDQIIDRNIGIPTETWLSWLKAPVEKGK